MDPICAAWLTILSIVMIVFWIKLNNFDNDLSSMAYSVKCRLTALRRKIYDVEQQQESANTRESNSVSAGQVLDRKKDNYLVESSLRESIIPEQARKVLTFGDFA